MNNEQRRGRKDEKMKRLDEALARQGSGDDSSRMRSNALVVSFSSSFLSIY